MQIVGIAVWVLWVLVLVAAGAVCECFRVIAMFLGMEFNSFLHVQKLICFGLNCYCRRSDLILKFYAFTFKGTNLSARCKRFLAWFSDDQFDFTLKVHFQN